MGDEEDDLSHSMPPLESGGSAASQRSGFFSPGDTVKLSGLKQVGLNGEEASVLKAVSSTDQRVEVKILRTGKNVAVKGINLERVAQTPQDSADSDDSLPPLEAP